MAKQMLSGYSRGAAVVPYNVYWSNFVRHTNTDSNVTPVYTPTMPIALVPYSNGEPLSRDREFLTLVNEELKLGTYEVEFDGIDFPSGVYYYKLISNSFIETKKFVLLK
jgi:hypothetical protein